MNKRNQVLIGGGIAAVVILIIVAVVLLRGRNSQGTDSADNGPTPVGGPGYHRPGGPGGPGGPGVRSATGGQLTGRQGGLPGIPGGGPGHRPGPGAKPGAGLAGNPALPGQRVGALGPGGLFGNVPGGKKPSNAQIADVANKLLAANGSNVHVTANDVANFQASLAPIPHKPKFDPFFIDWKVLPPPNYVFREIEPIRLASQDIEVAPSKPYVVREEPILRVSGIMSGDGVYAILEGPGGRADIVRPGSQIEITTSQTKRTYRVVSILEDSVKLEAKDGNATYTQIVPLSDTLPAGDNGPGGYVGSGGFPGSGGGRPSGAGARFGNPKNSE